MVGEEIRVVVINHEGLGEAHSLEAGVEMEAMAVMGVAVRWDGSEIISDQIGAKTRFLLLGVVV